MKFFSSGGALVATALFSGSLLFWAKPSEAQAFLPPPQQQQEPALAQTNNQEPMIVTASPASSASSGVKTALPETVRCEVKGINKGSGLSQPISYVATAYSLRGRTASGKYVSKGLIAADPRILPLGSRVHVEAGAYSGEYLVADTGGIIRGRKIDIWTPSTREAMRFGRRKVKLTVLSYGGKRSVRARRARI